MTSLVIDNLTHEDSGQYWVQVVFLGGRELIRVFHLTVWGTWHPSPHLVAASFVCP